MEKNNLKEQFKKYLPLVLILLLFVSLVGYGLHTNTKKANDNQTEKTNETVETNETKENDNKTDDKQNTTVENDKDKKDTSTIKEEDKTDSTVNSNNTTNTTSNTNTTTNTKPNSSTTTNNSNNNQNNSSGGEGSSQNTTPTPTPQQEHVHNWVYHDAVYTTVHHDAVPGKEVFIETKPGRRWTEEIQDPIYECKYDDERCLLEPDAYYIVGYETKTMEHVELPEGYWTTQGGSDAWDEQVLVSAAYYECSCGARK